MANTVHPTNVSDGGTHEGGHAQAPLGWQGSLGLRLMPKASISDTGQRSGETRSVFFAIHCGRKRIDCEHPNQVDQLNSAKLEEDPTKQV